MHILAISAKTLKNEFVHALKNSYAAILRSGNGRENVNRVQVKEKRKSKGKQPPSLAIFSPFKDAGVKRKLAAGGEGATHRNHLLFFITKKLSTNFYFFLHSEFINIKEPLAIS